MRLFSYIELPLPRSRHRAKPNLTKSLSQLSDTTKTMQPVSKPGLSNWLPQPGFVPQMITVLTNNSPSLLINIVQYLTCKEIK
jgi:hypothetical protein